MVAVITIYPKFAPPTQYTRTVANAPSEWEGWGLRGGEGRFHERLRKRVGGSFWRQKYSQTDERDMGDHFEQKSVPWEGACSFPKTRTETQPASHPPSDAPLPRYSINQSLSNGLVTSRPLPGPWQPGVSVGGWYGPCHLSPEGEGGV